MRQFAKLGLGSLVLLGTWACGARSELDNSGYADDTTALGLGSVTQQTTVPSPTTAPFVPPAPVPNTVPVTPTVNPIPVPDDTIITDSTTTGIAPDVGPCTNADAAQRGLQIRIPETPAPVACGDGSLGPGENCDDGNFSDGDGCDTSCNIEPNYDCSVPGVLCTPIGWCGDGILVWGEQCEVPGSPGCSMDCTVQAGWVCPPNTGCISSCGDGITVGSEQCDDGNNVPNDGCTSDCSYEWDYCLQTGYCAAPLTGVCGNEIVEFGENCDQGGGTEFCDANCQLTPRCDSNGDCQDICGNGVLNRYEQCDDGNTRRQDGCDGNCYIEDGYTCDTVERYVVPTEPLPGLGDAGASSIDPTPVPQEISVCAAACGDGIQQRGEACDPGAHSFCTASCTLVSEYCGNGVVDPGEACDDGLNTSLDLSACAPGCRIQGCGDGIIQAPEQCDLGTANNVGSYEGCTSSCALAARCGDGVVQVCGGETCDDGNVSGRDGCSSACRVERDTL